VTVDISVQLKYMLNQDDTQLVSEPEV